MAGQDALGDLLSGVPGFSKPSLANLKKNQGAHGSPQPAAQRPPSSNGTSARAPAQPPAPPDPFAAEALDRMVKSSSSPGLAQQQAPQR